MVLGDFTVMNEWINTGVNNDEMRSVDLVSILLSTQIYSISQNNAAVYGSELAKKMTHRDGSPLSVAFKVRL